MRRAILISLLCVSTVFAAVSGRSEKASREVIVKWRCLPAQLDAELLPVNAAAHVQCIRAALPVNERTSIGLERISIIETNTVSAVSELVSLLRNDPRVEYVEPRVPRYLDDLCEDRGNPFGSLDGVPNDPYYNQQWGLRIMEAEAAWNITRGDPSVAIAVLDLGVDFTHPELIHARWENTQEVNGFAGVDDDGNGYVDDIYGWDFVDGDGEPLPNPLAGAESHGTHVAGLASAARNNGQGIAGLAPDCQIMGVRVGGEGSIDYGYDGIYYACRSGAKVINCSWGGDAESAYERDIIEYVLDQGCVVVASAGNSHVQDRHYPAGIEGVLSVAASRMDDLAANFTQFGTWVKVSAPGVVMISTICTDGAGHGYDVWQGTSMSAPLVAATCGLVASRFPGISGREIMARVLSSCDPMDDINPDYAGLLGFGRVNAWRALEDSLPGLRLGKPSFHEIEGNGDGRIRAGEKAEVRISIFNDWMDAQTVVGYVATTSADVSLRNPVLVFGNIPRGGPYMSTTAMEVQLSETVARGFILPLSIDLVGANGRVVGRGTTVVYLDSTFVNVDNGQLSLGFAENGCLGYKDYVHRTYLGDGLRLSERSNALYHGSFVLAADGLVSDNAYGNSAYNRFDWVTTDDNIAHFVSSDRADIEARAVFEDRQTDIPLFAQVNAACLGWQSANDNQYLILEYAVENRSVNPWNETYAGFFLDWDLGPSGGNRAGYDEESDIAFVQATAPGHPLAGIVPLHDAWSTFYVVDNRAEIDPPGNWSDSLKWALLQQGMGTIREHPLDLSFLIACGPFAMAGHETRTFAYAMVSGEDIQDLRVQAERARERYGVQREPRRSYDVPSVKAGLYPNPLPAGESPKLVLPVRQEATVRLFNILGQQIAEYPRLIAGPNGAVLNRMFDSQASGVVFYRIDGAAGQFSGKLLILK
ncbi:MAG: S8 family serine peptidase [Calditrichota bacterium]